MNRRWSGLVLTVLIGVGAGADWSRFRGPNGFGTSPETKLPIEWSSTKHVAWRTKLPGPGTSSPVIIGNRVFVTCYSGYALSVDKPGDIKNLKRHAVCLERTTGKILWQQEFAALQPESEYSGGNNTWHGYASSTPAADERHLYLFFGKSGVYCLDQASGATVWHSDVGDRVTGWGSANSLVLFENLLIVNATIESSTLRALDKQTGKEVWQIGGVKGARNTPNLVTTANGATELVYCTPGDPQGKIIGVDPRSGQELWSCQGIPDGGYVNPSVIADQGVVFAIGGRKNTAIAVRAGGRGDVTETHRLWVEAKGANVTSPAYHDGCLYWVHERKGTLICLDAKSGETIYEERITPRPGVVYSSITVADGKIYAVSQMDGTFVFATGREFKQLAHNTFDDQQRTNACLAIDRGQLLLRDDGSIYCLGNSSAKP